MGLYLVQFFYLFYCIVVNCKYLVLFIECFVGYEFVVELWYVSWDKFEVCEGMGEFGIIWVSLDYLLVGGMFEFQVYVIGDVGYLCLYGCNCEIWWEGQSVGECYDYFYNCVEMDEWVEKIVVVVGDFFELYVFFQNMIGGYVFKNIFMLCEVLNVWGVLVQMFEVYDGGRLL